jgi:hypothetical protein
MTGFTIARLGLKFLRWNALGLRRAAGLAVFGVGPGAEDNGEQRSRRESLDNLHDLPPKIFAPLSQGAPFFICDFLTCACFWSALTPFDFQSDLNRVNSR